MKAVSRSSVTAPVLTVVDDLAAVLVNRAHGIRCDRWVDGGRLVPLGDAPLR